MTDKEIEEMDIGSKEFDEVLIEHSKALDEFAAYHWYRLFHPELNLSRKPLPMPNFRRVPKKKKGDNQ